MTEVLLTSVIFDTDGDTSLAATLSEEWTNVLFTLPTLDESDEEVVADYLSEKTGWCVDSLTVQYAN